MITREDLAIDRHHNGITISTMKGGYRIKSMYILTDEEEAIADFLEEHNESVEDYATRELGDRLNDWLRP